jgi:hypothetical protein
MWLPKPATRVVPGDRRSLRELWSDFVQARRRMRRLGADAAVAVVGCCGVSVFILVLG